MTVVSFAAWLPDQADLNGQATGDILNVLCSTGSYLPFPDLAALSSALSAEPLGFFTARSLSGQVTIFAGTATKLWKLDNTTLTWEHVSKLAANQAVNGTFATDTGWTKDAGWTIAAGVATATTAASGNSISQAQSFTAATIYKVVFTVSGFSAGGVRPVLSGGTSVNGTTRAANGTFTEYLTAVTGNTTFELEAVGTTTLNVDNVTVQALTNYAANATARWCFEQFGEYVVAVNINDDPQVFQLGVSTDFAALAGSPPRASFVKAWGDFLCLMQLATNANRVHWSALNDITGWTPGTNNSDYQDFPEGGVVQGSSRATNPLIILERAIYLGTFVPGSSIIFSFVKIHDGRGAKSPYSIASRGENTFFADEGSFFQITSDGAIADIGFEKVSRTIFGQLAASDVATMVGAIDPFYSRVYWTMDLTGAGIYGAILVYDWLQTRWSIANQANVGIFPAATAGYTLEGLDAISTNLDALAYSLDSKVWQGGAPILAAFGSDFKLGFFNGTNKEAIITTSEKGDLSGRIAVTSSAYAVVDTDNYTMAIGSRMKRGAVVTWTSEITPTSATGRCDKMLAARFQRFRTTIPAGVVWTHAQGIEVSSKDGGAR